MKKIFALIMLATFAFCFASEQVNLEINPNMTLRQISDETHIPVNKIIHLLDGDYSEETTVAKTGLTNDEINKAIKRYDSIKTHYYWSIVAVGMVIVFIALIITGFVIGLLKHFNKVDSATEKKTVAKRSKTKIKKITPIEGNLSNDAVVAVVTAIYLHELEVEEKNKINLTWKRQRLSMWKSSNMTNLPNSSFYKLRRK
jgi:Na+-transporting methylmalonyl-CoA/oxaloacetate decarboxylase gamma subunit